MSEFITMAHGNGGAAMQKLIQDYFVEAFANPILAQGEDQARIPLTELAKQGETLSFSTDSFVIDPIFFPGGNIGKLACAAQQMMWRCVVRYQNIYPVALF